jgi:hypothetical protein
MCDLCISGIYKQQRNSKNQSQDLQTLWGRVMSKNKPFEPDLGWVVKVHQIVASTRLAAEKLGVAPYTLSEALEGAGVYVEADIMRLQGDATKVILMQEKNQGLKAVINEQPNTDSATSGEQTSGVES